MRSATDFADFDRAGRAGAFVTFFCLFAGADLRAVDLVAAAVLEVRAVAFFCDDTLFALFFAVLPLEETISFDLVALRAGAFSAAERLTIGAGRAADLLPNVRPLAEDVEEV